MNLKIIALGVLAYILFFHKAAPATMQTGSLISVNTPTKQTVIEAGKAAVTAGLSVLSGLFKPSATAATIPSGSTNNPNVGILT